MSKTSKCFDFFTFEDDYEIDEMEEMQRHTEQQQNTIHTVGVAQDKKNQEKKGNIEFDANSSEFQFSERPFFQHMSRFQAIIEMWNSLFDHRRHVLPDAESFLTIVVMSTRNQSGKTALIEALTGIRLRSFSYDEEIPILSTQHQPHNAQYSEPLSSTSGQRVQCGSGPSNEKVGESLRIQSWDYIANQGRIPNQGKYDSLFSSVDAEIDQHSVTLDLLPKSSIPYPCRDNTRVHSTFFNSFPDTFCELAPACQCPIRLTLKHNAASKPSICITFPWRLDTLIPSSLSQQSTTSTTQTLTFIDVPREAMRINLLDLISSLPMVPLPEPLVNVFRNGNYPCYLILHDDDHLHTSTMIPVSRKSSTSQMHPSQCRDKERIPKIVISIPSLCFIPAMLLWSRQIVFAQNSPNFHSPYDNSAEPIESNRIVEDEIEIAIEHFDLPTISFVEIPSEQMNLTSNRQNTSTLSHSISAQGMLQYTQS